MAGVAYSDDRVDQIGYPDSEMLNETFYIYKDTDDSSMQCGDIASYSGKKIGTLKDNQRMTAALDNGKPDTVPILRLNIIRILWNVPGHLMNSRSMDL